MLRLFLKLCLGISAVLASGMLMAETVVVSPATTTAKEVIVTPTVTKEQVIVTPAPEAKEVIEIPTGYANCFTVNSGWYNNEWIPQHRVCQYKDMPGKAAWIEGYWACTKYKTETGSCTEWKWRAGRWVETLVVY